MLVSDCKTFRSLQIKWPHLSDQILALYALKSPDWPQIYHGVVQNRTCMLLLVLPHSITVTSAVLTADTATSFHNWHTDSYFLFFELYIVLPTLHQSFQSGIMSSSDAHRSAPLSLPLTVCMYLFTVMSSVFIVAGSLALIIAGACWVR